MPIKDLIVCSDKAIEAPALPVHKWLFQELEQHLRELGDKDWLINGYTNDRQKFSHILPKSKAVASAITKLGFKKGDVLMLYSYNNVNYFYPVLAAWICGGAATFAEPASLSDQVVHKAKDSHTTLIFADESTYTRAIEVMENCPQVRKVLTFEGNGGFADLLRDNGGNCPDDVEIDIHKDIAYLPYSSGSTGFPKGIMHTYYTTGNLLIRGLIKPGADEKGFFSTPMYHLTGFICSMCAISDFSTMVFTREYSPQSYVEAISVQKPTTVFSAPLAYGEILNSSKDHDLSSLKHIAAGGWFFGPELKRKLMAFLPNLETINVVWGMTEVGVGILTPKELLSDPSHRHSASVGKVGVGMELKFVDENGKSLGPNCPGEICIRSNCNMVRYLNRDKESASTITTDGWVHTGDCGYYTEDEYIYFNERMKDLIKYRGFHVVPAVLEEILLSHPAITEAAIIGIPQPDVGEYPCACVVYKENYNPHEEEIVEYVNQRVCEYEKIRGGVKVFDRLPYIGIGKISRKDLRKWVAES